MFENMTFENIMNDMLSQVSKDVDKREGSIIYDALAPCAYKIAETYFLLDNYINLIFANTAVGEYLDRVVEDHGITRKPATKALRKIEATGSISIGTRWGINDTTYVVLEALEENTYSAECEQEGEVGNLYTGTLTNIDNVQGVTTMLTDIIQSGTDVEDDESLRTRFFAKVQSPTSSGNVNDYRRWAMEVPGVGNSKVFPLWDGPGTVKVLIVNSDMEIDETLEQAVYEHIEESRPIGADVTVDSPSGVVINVTADIVLDGTKTIEETKLIFVDLLSQYLKSVVFEETYVSYAKVGSLILETEGILDYSGLLVNENTVNLTVEEEEMPITGTVIFTEVS